MSSTVKDKKTRNNDDLKKVKGEIDELLEETYKCAKHNLKAGDPDKDKDKDNVHDKFTLRDIRVDVEKMKEQIVVALPLAKKKIICNDILCRDITIDEKTGGKSNRYGDQKCEFYIVPSYNKKLQNGTQKVSKESYISIEDDWHKIVKEIFDQVFSVTSLQPEQSTRDKPVEEGDNTSSSTPDATQAEDFPKIMENSGRGGANRPTEMLYEYMVEGKRTVHPLHTVLQNDFVSHLKSQGVECEQNTHEYIDILYKNKGLSVIAEVKPAESVGTKYAIRAAIGQLFEYRYTYNKSYSAIPLLHIVLDKKPEENEIEFVKSLGIILSYKDESDAFVTIDDAPSHK